MIDQRVELGRDGEDHMEIRYVDDFGPAGIDPDLFKDGLAVRAAAAAAGIVMELHMAAVLTGGDITAQ